MGTILHCLVHFPSAYFACCLYIALVEHTTEGYWAVQYTELLLQQNETEDYILKLIVVIVRWISATLVCIELFYLFLLICYCEYTITN